MKKFLKVMAAAMAVIALAVAFAGCTIKVSGKTFVFSEVRIELPKDASEDDKTAAEAAKAIVELGVKNVKYTFKDDGTMGSGLGKWTQDGKKVTITTAGVTTAEFTVNGKKLEQGTKQGNYSFTIVYKEG